LLLTQLFTSKKLFEGGNLSTTTPGWMGVPGEHEANEIELKIHNRSFMVGILDKLLRNIDKAYSAQFKSPIWSPELLNKRAFLSGSSLHFFNVNDIPDEVFVQKKPKVGDIDTQIDANLEPNIEQFLKSITGKQVGNATFLGYKYGNNQYSSLWELKEVPVKIQIDFEFGRYDPKTNEPDQWFAYSHSSEWNDVEAGIKGVFHKYLNRALAAISTSEKYVARVLKKSTKISPEPVTDNDLSFAVSGPGGGGMSRKYVPYVDPSTGEPMVQNGIPVMRLLEPKDRDYIQNLGQQFELIYGRKPSKQDSQLMNSFLGTIDLMNKYLDDQQRASVANDFLEILFSSGAQMLTKDDPSRDREAKFAAIDNLVEKLKLPDAKSYRQQAINMAKAYEDSFLSKKKPLAEAEVKAQLRKGMPHLHDLKSADFLDLLDELHQGNGQFKLQNIPLNVKIDGFGGRFGKNAEGKPFMGTSRTEPRYQAGFVDYHQKKGTTDPEILGRAKLFDDLFNEMMEAVKLVDSKLGPEFLVNKQITCEVLYLPFATETPEGKLKFVGIHYDKLPQGVQLALVPFRVVDAETGEDLPDSTKVIKELTSVGKQGSVMFIDNSLTQNEALDVTAIVPPLENIEQMKAMLASKKRDQAAEVKAALEPVKVALEKAIIEDPNIVGKDMLGKDYEGIVINSRMGPIKITSQEQRDVISAKNAAMASARSERPRGENKTAVVAIGSFVGHIGHEQLFDYTIKKARSVGGDPYLFIGNAEGKDDPIPPSVKVQTWHKMYPEYAKNISTVTQQGGSLLQKIKHELINPLPGKPPRYDNIIIMVGEDQAGLTMPQALMKAVNKFQGYEHVKVSLEATPRGTGMSFTKLRNILKDPNATPEQQLQVWSQGFDVKKLGVDWIKHLMDLTRKGMGIQMPQKQKPVVAERLLNALICPKETLEETKRMSAAMKLQRAWDRERAKSDASRERMRRELELIGGKKPQEEPKKDQGVAEGGEKYKVKSIGRDAKGDYYISPNTGKKVYKKGVKVGDHENPKTGEHKGVAEGKEKKCPPATQDITLNLENRQKAIDEYGYGPLNPDMPNTKFWMKKVDEWNLDSVDEAKQSLCGNCAAFDQRQNTLDCIAQGIGSEQGAEDPTIEAGDLGYCRFLKFKCASLRTCDAWVTGGPLVDKQDVAEAGSPAQQAAIAISMKKAGKKPKSEAMLPKSAFAGSSKNKLGPAGQLKGNMKRPARAGDLVGGAAESTEKTLRNSNPCWKGYKPVGTKKKGGKTVPNCVPVSESAEKVMLQLIKMLESK